MAWVTKFRSKAVEELLETSHLVAMGHPRRAEALHRAAAFKEAADIIVESLACGGSLPGVRSGEIPTDTGGSNANPQHQQVDVDRFADGFHAVVLGDAARAARADRRPNG